MNGCDRYPQKARPLLVGIGNPLRSDDGLGWAAAGLLAKDEEADYDIQMVHQLTPELAQEMVAASLVVMIDASTEGEPGDLRIRAVTTSNQPSAVGTHYTMPGELVALTVGVYGHCPPVVVVTMTGANFSMGEQLSSIVAQRLPLVSEVTHQICNQMSKMTVRGTVPFWSRITALIDSWEHSGHPALEQYESTIDQQGRSSIDFIKPSGTNARRP